MSKIGLIYSYQKANPKDFFGLAIYFIFLILIIMESSDILYSDSSSVEVDEFDAFSSPPHDTAFGFLVYRESKGVS